MTYKHALLRGFSHAGQNVRWRVETFLHACTNDSTSSAGTSQPCSPGCTSSGIPATNVLMTGRLNDMASMITTGRPSAKLASTRARAARISSRTCWLLIQPVMLNLACRLSRSIRALNLGAHLAVAREYNVEVNPTGCKAPRCFQQQLPFLLGQPTNANETADRRSGFHCRGVKSGLKPAMHHMHFGPMLVLHATVKLATPKRMMATTKAQFRIFSAI
jgi:hypothetical protein